MSYKEASSRAALEVARNMGETFAQFYVGSVAGGMDPDDALELTIEYMRTVAENWRAKKEEQE